MGWEWVDASCACLMQSAIRVEAWERESQEILVRLKQWS
jgi:hypothetical protein